MASIISRRSALTTGLAALGTAAIFAPAFAQQKMTAETMKGLIDLTLKRNKEDNKVPTRLGVQVAPVLFGSSAEVRFLQLGNDEGALKERFAVTVNLSQQHVVMFSRTEDAIYFHRTGVHLRREMSAVNRRKGGVSAWSGPDAVKDFSRQMSYWANRL